MSFHGHDSFADNMALAPAEPPLDADCGDTGVGGNAGGEHAQSDGEDSELPLPGGPAESNLATDSGAGSEVCSDTDTLAAAAATAPTAARLGQQPRMKCEQIR